MEDKQKTGCYYTFTKDYEIQELGNCFFASSSLELFRDLLAKHCVYRGQKPVYWSPQSHTALAEAELECVQFLLVTRRYNGNHRSESIYLTFDLTQSPNPAIQQLIDQATQASQTISQSSQQSSQSAQTTPQPLQALVYTTTPWTVPSNKCLSVNPDAEYCVVETPQHRGSSLTPSRAERFLVMRDRLDALAALFHTSFTLRLDHVPGLSLQGSTYAHPLFRTSASLRLLTHSLHTIVAGRHVTNDVGTGIVHTAPAHGLDDFNVCRYHGIIRTEETLRDNGIPRVALPPGVACEPLREDVDDDGRFSATWGARLTGKDVLSDGNNEVVGAATRREAQMAWLRDTQHLFFRQPITHRYPWRSARRLTRRYDWRAKTPVIFRVTPQWFVDIKRITQDGRLEQQLRVGLCAPSQPSAPTSSPPPRARACCP